MHRLHHIGIAVRDLSESIEKYRQLGLSTSEPEVVAGEGVRVAFVDLGGSRIELLESLNSEGVIARFIEKRGEGVHHIAVEVGDIEAAISQAISHGFRMVDDKPRVGSRGRLVAFVHPSSLGGVLLELVQENGR